jgi:eukaryotic-like serine/threonine-protein kinase
VERSDRNQASAGAQIGERYELLRPLARGGMGQVWVGRHLGLDRLVAVKLIEETSAGQGLLTEARLLAKLRHPNVVQVFDCGTDATGTPFVVMELLEGPTLATYLEGHGALGAVAATRLLLPILDALSAVHAAGLVHRDLKPDNVVLVPSGAALPVPKLIDFGIARVTQAEAAGQTASGTFVGTPQYMSPEQIHGARGDVRGDVWGATAVLYEAIAGRPAFVGEDVAQVFHAIVHDPPAFPAHVRDLDGKLWSVLMLGLRKLPSERHASCDVLAAALRHWLSHPDRQEVSPPPLTNVAPAKVASSIPDAATLSAVQLRPAGPMGPLDELMRKKGPLR